MWYKGARKNMKDNEGRLTALKRELGDLFSLKKNELSGSWLAALVALAFLIRLPLAFFPEVIYNDGVEYIRIANHILGGNWSEGFVPPVYPALVAALGFFVRDFELAGILISIVFGAAIVLPVYHFTKVLFDGRTAIIAAIFAVFQPLLYVYSGSVLTESTYYFIVAMIALFGWLAFTEGRVINILLFSFLVAMSYLTKPEGLGFLLIFLVWLVCINPPGKGKRLLFTRLWMAVLAVVCFTVVSLPYLIQIRNDLGSWQLSKKAAVSVGGVQQDDEEGVRETAQQHPKRRVDISTYVRNPVSLMAKVSLGFLESLFKFQQGFTPYLFLFAIVGLLRKVNGSYPWKQNLYILSNVVFFFALVLPFFWITKRYTSQMMPMILPLAAWGFLGVVSWLARRLDGREVHWRGFNGLCIGLVALALLTQGVLSTGRGHRQIQKDVGLWMKANLPRETKLMSRLPQEGFYAQMPWTRIKKNTYGDIISDARSQGANCLVIDDVVLKNVKDFRENIAQGDLILMKEWKKGNRQILLFQTIASGSS
jgi:4-amino-4-deoxy-L-arabinose transferase-like glycosyltransferase